ncbi:MAG: tyrosine-type recombinase/integrase, partial [Treponema sp.]|nr:tyrosine-type recombinase/integrase [Treponema sp.]
MEIVYFFYESGVVRIPLFKYDDRLFGLLVPQGGVWDKVNSQFLFRLNKAVDLLRLVRPRVCVQVDAKLPEPIRVSGFYEFPWEKNSLESNPQITKQPVTKHPIIQQSVIKQPVTKQSVPLNRSEKFSEYWQQKLETELRSRKYSLRTLRSYVYYNQLLCRTVQKIPEEINTEDIINFCGMIEKENEYSASSLNLVISAIKFFYKEIIKNGIIEISHRPRQDKKLPMVLSRAEIKKILGMEKNIKHRLLLMLAYSSGLRVSEIVSLKKEHIDLSRQVIYVRYGKGRKDRCTILSARTAMLIREYCQQYDIQTWLFQGRPTTRPLTIRSAQMIFYKAV